MKKKTKTKSLSANRELLFSVTLDDCVVKLSSSGGPGGQNVNRRSTKVDILHPPSGARAVCSEERSQLQNKKIAWRRMCETPEFKSWVRKQAGGEELTAVQVERELWPDRTKVEVQNENGEWVEMIQNRRDS